jgi:hypothetical protein
MCSYSWIIFWGYSVKYLFTNSSYVRFWLRLKPASLYIILAHLSILLCTSDPRGIYGICPCHFNGQGFLQLVQLLPTYIIISNTIILYDHTLQLLGTPHFLYKKFLLDLFLMKSRIHRIIEIIHLNQILMMDHV